MLQRRVTEEKWRKFLSRSSPAGLRRRAEEKLRVAQAITDAKIEELTREVRKHNNFAEKIPVIQEQIKVVNHRLADLEDIERKDHP